jgi:hypothetical protein
MEHGAPIAPPQAQWYEHLLRGETHAMDRHRRFEVWCSVYVESLHN